MCTEAEFLKTYSIEKYPRPALTGDTAAFCRTARGAALLLIRRGNHPYRGKWALPGGFCAPGETLEACAARELTEETGIVPASLLQVGVFSTPGRDPRGWIVSGAYACILPPEAAKNAAGADDAAAAAWFDVSFSDLPDGRRLLRLTCGELTVSAAAAKNSEPFAPAYRTADAGELAFDHAAIIAAALDTVRGALPLPAAR